MYTKKLSKGFTLIELLVVIAIIGILAALVLVALGNARDKANDARVKSNVGQLRTIAEIIYDSNNASYLNDEGTKGVEPCIDSGGSTACTSSDIDTNVATLKADIEAANGAIAVTAESDASSFCIEAALNDSTFVCVDSSGQTQTGHTAARCESSAGDTDCAS